jgi:hypothetical protein
MIWNLTEKERNEREKQKKYNELIELKTEKMKQLNNDMQSVILSADIIINNIDLAVNRKIARQYL